MPLSPSRVLFCSSRDILGRLRSYLGPFRFLGLFWSVLDRSGVFPRRSGSAFRSIGVHDDDDVDDGDDDDNDDGDDVDGAALCFLHMRRSMHMVIIRVRASTERWPPCGNVQARCDSVHGIEKKKERRKRLTSSP